MDERVVDSICITSGGTIIFELDGSTTNLLPNKLSIIVDGQQLDIEVILPLIQEYLRH